VRLRRNAMHKFRQITCVLLLAVSMIQASAQSKRAVTGKSPLCTHDNALEMIKQQVALTKTFNNSIRRITVLIQAADLLWPHQQDKARAAFTEAFELATETEKENDPKGPRSIILRLQVPDQRYIVIRAVAKRDSVWAKELTRQLLKRDIDDRTALSTRDSFNDLLTAERLLNTAREMIATDLNGALDLARASLKYPAGFMLTHFLYQLAAVNQAAADQFYAQALAVYGDKPRREFLYLQGYPFAFPDALNTPIFSFFKIPTNFVTSQSLQRQFVQVALRRARQALEAPVDQTDMYQDAHQRLLPGPVHLLQTLIRLEPKVRQSLPDLLPALTQARENILVSLSVENQKIFLQPGREVSTEPDQTFDEQIELGQKIRDVDERNQFIASVILGSDTKSSLTKVLEAIDEISDSTLRGHLLDWLYFRRAAAAIREKDFEEAEKLASRVEGLEQRAHLHTELAKGLLNSAMQGRAREVLDQGITEAKKAGASIFAARTLLTASNLYAKIDLSRSISVLADAINCINRLEAPDFSGEPTLEKTPERRGRGGRYEGEYEFRFYMPGLDSVSAFREMSKIDFDNALSMSSTLTDKFQRAMSTLAIAEACLGQPPRRTPR
jgi:hypothetical protein